MDLSVLLLALGGFLGGLLVTSRVIAWITGLILFFKRVPPAEARSSQAFVFAPLLLHSGPWALGLALAVALLAMAVLWVHLRQRSAQPAPQPLTPDRLRIIRGRFFWGNTLFFGVFMTVLLVSQFWAIFGRSIILVGMVFVVSLAGGWLYALFMWQWYGAALEVREMARQRQEQRNAG